MPRNQREMLCQRKDFLFNPDKKKKTDKKGLSAREERRLQERLKKKQGI